MTLSAQTIPSLPAGTIGSGGAISFIWSISQGGGNQSNLYIAPTYDGSGDFAAPIVSSQTSVTLTLKCYGTGSAISHDYTKSVTAPTDMVAHQMAAPTHQLGTPNIDYTWSTTRLMPTTVSFHAVMIAEGTCQAQVTGEFNVQEGGNTSELKHNPGPPLSISSGSANGCDAGGDHIMFQLNAEQSGSYSAGYYLWNIPVLIGIPAQTTVNGTTTYDTSTMVPFRQNPQKFTIDGSGSSGATKLNTSAGPVGVNSTDPIDFSPND